MHRLVTTGGPAGPLLYPQGMIGTANQKLAVVGSLEMAFHASVRVANREELGVNRSVRLVATGATFAHRFMFERKGPSLSRVAAQAAFILRKKRGSTAHMSRPFVRRMAITATHPSFR